MMIFVIMLCPKIEQRIFSITKKYVFFKEKHAGGMSTDSFAHRAFEYKVTCVHRWV